MARSGIALAVIAVLVALAVVLDLGPFGGEANDEELSTAEFLARGDEICQDAQQEFGDLQREQPNTASEAAALTARLIDISERELGGIDTLNGPAELEPGVERYLESRRQGIEQLRKGFEAAEQKDAFAYAAAQAKVAGAQLDRLELAREVGFTECSRPLVGSAELERQSQPPG